MAVEWPSKGGNDDGVPSIKELIQDALGAGKTVRELEADSGHRVKYQTFQELSRRAPKQFPKDLKTVAGMAQALRVTETAVVLAYAKGLGIEVTGESAFAMRLPPGVDQLTREMQDALVKLVRAAMHMSAGRGRGVPSRDEMQDGRGVPVGWLPPEEGPGVGGRPGDDRRHQLGGG